jgi:hypothetical protein
MTGCVVEDMQLQGQLAETPSLMGAARQTKQAAALQPNCHSTATQHAWLAVVVHALPLPTVLWTCRNHANYMPLPEHCALGMPLLQGYPTQSAVCATLQAMQGVTHVDANRTVVELVLLHSCTIVPMSTVSVQRYMLPPLAA